MKEEEIYKCHYCYLKSLDIDKVKAHEEYQHGCFRDINPRNAKPKSKKKVKITDRIWFARHLPIHKGDFRIDVLYELYNDGSYRMYTDDLKYGDHLEIVFNDDKQMYSIKDLDKVRSEYYAKQDKDVVTNVGSFERLIDELS